MKVLLRVVLVCAGLCVLFGIGITACVVRVADDAGWNAEFLKFEFGSGNWSSKAQRTETHALEFPAEGELHVKVPAGEVRVRSSETDAPSLVAHITAYGKDDAQAKQWLDKTTLDIASNSTGVRVESRVEGDSVRTQPQIDLEIIVPARARLSIETGSGAIRADGASFGTTRLKSSYGGISVAGVRGQLSATSSSGAVEASDVQGPRCEIRSGYGNLVLARVEADEIQATTSSGSLKASALRAKKAVLDSGYGGIGLTDIEGEFTAKSSSGSIRAEQLRGGPFSLSSSYGGIRVTNARGILTTKTSSGDIAVEAHEGAVIANTSYGSVQIDGVLDGVIAQTSSGSMSIAAHPGSQVASDWKAVSNYGHVKCVLPAELAFDLAAKTGYGEIELGYDIAVSAGGLMSGKHVAGKINGGGRRFDVTTSSGNITITPEAR